MCETAGRKSGRCVFWEAFFWRKHLAVVRAFTCTPVSVTSLRPFQVGRATHFPLVVGTTGPLPSRKMPTRHPQCCSRKPGLEQRKHFPGRAVQSVGSSFHPQAHPKYAWIQQNPLQSQVCNRVIHRAFQLLQPHASLKNGVPRTPAMAAGLTHHIWTIEELVRTPDCT